MTILGRTTTTYEKWSDVKDPPKEVVQVLQDSYYLAMAGAIFSGVVLGYDISFIQRNNL